MKVIWPTGHKNTALGSVYYFDLNGLRRCILSLDKDIVAEESKWLVFLKVLLQVGYSCHPLIAREEGFGS